MADLETSTRAAFIKVANDIKAIQTELKTSTKTIYINSSTGAWPNNGARTVVAGYTGIVIWHALNVNNAPMPAGAIDGDVVLRRMP